MSPYQDKSSSPPSLVKTMSSSNVTPPPLPVETRAHDQQMYLVSSRGHAATVPGQDPDIESTDALDPQASRKLPWIGTGGGVAVCVSGPSSLVREASNAVARLRLSQRGMEMGGLDIHTEVFSL